MEVVEQTISYIDDLHRSDLKVLAKVCVTYQHPNLGGLRRGLVRPTWSQPSAFFGLEDRPRSILLLTEDMWRTGARNRVAGGRKMKWASPVNNRASPVNRQASLVDSRASPVDSRASPVDSQVRPVDSPLSKTSPGVKKVS